MNTPMVEVAQYEHPTDYDLTIKKMLQPLGRKFNHFSVICANPRTIVLAGGYDCTKKRCSKESFELDLIANSWMQLPNLRVARYDHSSITIDSKVYVIAGYGGGKALDTIEILDLSPQPSIAW